MRTRGSRSYPGPGAEGVHARPGAGRARAEGPARAHGDGADPRATRAEQEFLGNVARLVPCEALGACLARNDGPILDITLEPFSYYERSADEGPEHNGPLYVGVMHWSRTPLQAAACQAILPGHVDGVAIGFRSGPDAVAQIFLERRSRPFSDRDLAMLDLLRPVFQRHLRQRATNPLPDCLTVQERRVLLEVAAGLSNADIAQALFIAPSTVREHLEHAYRKFGVANRIAAGVRSA